MGAIGLDGWKLGIQLIAFIAFILILRKTALTPIVTMLDKRQDRIRESMEAAQRMQKEMQATAARNEEILAAARHEAQQILTNAREAGEATIARARDEAGKQADDFMNRAQATLRAETEQARQQLRQEVADLAVAAATKIVRKELDASSQSRLIEETLSEAAGRGAAGSEPVA